MVKKLFALTFSTIILFGFFSGQYPDFESVKSLNMPEDSELTFIEGRDTETVNLIGRTENNHNVVFRHSSYEDFSGGSVSNSGHNLFVSRDGNIRFINWFDFDNDGYPEIAVHNDHDHYEHVDGFVYYNTQGRGFRSLMPPIHQVYPGFQVLEWMEESSRYMDRLKSIGGGRTLVADLNGDGYPEILFTNFIHGWSENHFPVFIYWGGEKGYSRSRVSYLPTLSASGLDAADINGNGRKDIVMANAGREYASRTVSFASYSEGEKKPVEEAVGYEEGTSFIYWQDAYGYSEDNRSELPTEFALDVAVADFNQDGYPDIVFLQSGRPGSIRIFYGTPEGIDSEKYFDIEALAPTIGGIAKKLLVADLNGNGRLDIFVPSSGDISEIFWNGTDGFSADNRSTISSKGAMAAASSDLNQDGFADLVIVNSSGPSWLYWGGIDGFSEKNRIDLPTNAATGVAIADLNNNGFSDIVFSNSMKGKSFDNPSFIYWGSDDGYHPADRDELWGYGAVDVAVGDFNRNGLNDIFLMNRQSGTTAPQFGSEGYTSRDLFVFWGNSRSRYSVASMSNLPGITAQSCALATDINGNGHADLIYTHNGKLNISYGDSQDFCKETNIQMDLPFHVNDVVAADLNRDGYLDIIVCSNRADEFAVFPGKHNGFEEPVRFDFDLPGEPIPALGDIDGDGNLDLVVGGQGKIIIFYGTEEGLFNTDNAQTINTGMFTRRLSLADFDGDGSLDILGHHFSTSDYRANNNVFSSIYWNRDGSFTVSNSLELPSHASRSGSVADVNNNGYLDILIANYNSQFKRNLETFIYWGDSTSNYSPDRMTGLPSYSPVANLVLDLNGNGINDIVVFNHVESNQYAGLKPIGGIHGTGSFIYWGSEEGWNVEMRDRIPSIGPHSRLAAEPGDVMRRRHYEEYISAPIPIGSVRGRYEIKVEGDFNFRQNIKVYKKAASSTQGLEKEGWKEINLKERFADHFLYEGSLGRGDTYLQYKIRLDTGGTGTGPVVRSVEMRKN